MGVYFAAESATAAEPVLEHPAPPAPPAGAATEARDALPPIPAVPPLAPATFWVGLFYMAAGTLCLTLREAALSPWAMGVPFGAGQLLAAAVLYWTLERTDGEPEEQAD